MSREVDWLRGWRVVLRMDNGAAVHYVNFRHGRILPLQELAGQFEFKEREAGCWTFAVHIQGKANVISNAASENAK